MIRGVDILLGEILAAIDLLRQYTDGLDYNQFASDVDIVVRRRPRSRKAARLRVTLG